MLQQPLQTTACWSAIMMQCRGLNKSAAQVCLQCNVTAGHMLPISTKWPGPCSSSPCSPQHSKAGNMQLCTSLMPKSICTSRAYNSHLTAGTLQLRNSHCPGPCSSSPCSPQHSEAGNMQLCTSLMPECKFGYCTTYASQPVRLELAAHLFQSPCSMLHVV